ncbi:MAG: hypothetical protein HQM16_15180 [Deltaproteobacteria bacterium]|nr:hypothetical protein [Deltaproteobacteria bacterium]
MRKQLFVLIFCVLLPCTALSQAIPLDKMSLRLIPRDADADVVGSKTITLELTPFGLKLLWYSLVKEFDEGAHYPTYKIKAHRGVVEVDNLEQKTVFFHPSLWGEGYLRTESALPLWLNPDYLDPESKQRMYFNVGILNLDKYMIKKAPDVIYDQVIFFQNLYDQYVDREEIREGLNLNKTDQKEIKKFIREFFYIKRIAKTKTEIYVNNRQESYPAVVFGNTYFQFVVVDDPLNPLIVSLRVIPEKAPKPFQESFSRFKKNFEFRVTQVSF